MKVIKSQWITPTVCAEGLDNGEIRLTCSTRNPAFTPDEFQNLIQFKTSFFTELVMRQAWKPLPELKTTETKLAEPPK